MTAQLIPVGIIVALLTVGSWCRRGRHLNHARCEEQRRNAQAWVELAVREEFGMPVDHPESLTNLLPWSDELLLADLDQQTAWDPEVAE